MLPFGLLGQVTTVIVLSLPLGAFRAPSYIIYERRLNYRPMAIVELVETTLYYVWAVATISMGWGVWALATGFVVRALFGSTLLLILLPEGRIAPVPSWTKVKKLLGFGFRYQAVGFLQHAARPRREHRGRHVRRGRGARALERRLADPSDPVLVLRRALARLVPRNVEARRRQGRRGRHDRARDRACGHRNRRARRAARSLCLPMDPRAHRGQMGGGRLGDPAGVLRDGVRRADLGGARGLPLGDRLRLGPSPRDRSLASLRWRLFCCRCSP